MIHTRQIVGGRADFRLRIGARLGALAAAVLFAASGCGETKEVVFDKAAMPYLGDASLIVWLRTGSLMDEAVLSQVEKFGVSPNSELVLAKSESGWALAMRGKNDGFDDWHESGQLEGLNLRQFDGDFVATRLAEDLLVAADNKERLAEIIRAARRGQEIPVKMHADEVLLVVAEGVRYGVAESQGGVVLTGLGGDKPFEGFRQRSSQIAELSLSIFGKESDAGTLIQALLKARPSIDAAGKTSIVAPLGGKTLKTLVSDSVRLADARKEIVQTTGLVTFWISAVADSENPPNRLVDLITIPGEPTRHDLLVDDWGSQLLYTTTKQDDRTVVSVCSNGPDRRATTSDDICRSHSY